MVVVGVNFEVVGEIWCILVFVFLNWVMVLMMFLFVSGVLVFKIKIVSGFVVSCNGLCKILDVE